MVRHQHDLEILSWENKKMLRKTLKAKSQRRQPLLNEHIESWRQLKSNPGNRFLLINLPIDSFEKSKKLQCFLEQY